MKHGNGNIAEHRGKMENAADLEEQNNPTSFKKTSERKQSFWNKNTMEKARNQRAHEKCKIQFWKNIEHRETPILRKNISWKKLVIRGWKNKFAKYNSGKMDIENLCSKKNIFWKN